MAAPTSTPFNRLLRGPINAAAYPAASGQQINQGDLCVFFSGNLYPATAWGNVITWSSGGDDRNQSGARATFVGVALGQSNSTSTFSGSVPVLLNGIFSYPFMAASGVYTAPGSFVGFTQSDPNNTGNSGYFAPQAVGVVNILSGGTIGKVVEPFTATTSGQYGLLAVELQSFVGQGGIANAP